MSRDQALPFLSRQKYWRGSAPQHLHLSAFCADRPLLTVGALTRICSSLLGEDPHRVTRAEGGADWARPEAEILTDGESKTGFC